MTVLVTVKAYPALSHKHGEVVCVAGVRVDGSASEWVRLFPVAFRDMAFADRFRKYQLITLDVTRPLSDRRPESWTPNLASLRLGEVLDTKQGWRRRKELLAGLPVLPMCEVLARQSESGMSLAMTRPVQVDELDIVPHAEFDEVKAGLAGQGGLFGPAKMPLEPAPYTAKYLYRCGEPTCRGHTQGLIDWEFVEASRSWRSRYPEPELRERLREKWLEQMCGPDKDTVFFVGNQHQAPRGFLVLGVFWPPGPPA